MNNLETMPEKKKWTDVQKDYNVSSKAIVHLIGTNISLLVCIFLPLLLVGFIWTEFGAIKVDVKFISDGVITVALFIIGELMMMRVGASGGKLDSEYKEAKSEYDRLVKEVNEIGTMFMAVFCEWQIDLEMKQAIATRLRYLHLKRTDWDATKDMSYRQLKKKYGRKKANKIYRLNRIEPVELNDSILLFNGNDVFARGGVPISGEEYISKKSHSVGLILSSLFTALLSVSVVLTLTTDITFARVMYTAVKLVILFFRMAQGYDIGAKAYNTVEVKRLSAKNNYLRQYLRFVTDKTYLRLGNEYGDVSCYEETQDTETTEETQENPIGLVAEIIT